jgi:hypothetical protein
MKRQSRHNEEAHIGGRLTIRTFRNGELLRTIGPFPNKVVSSSGYGRNIILRQMARDTTYQLGIDSAAVGDDNTAPADGDTGLGNPLVSSLTITNASVVNNVLTVDVFVASGELPEDTYEEFGLFANGRLMARVIISPAYTKVSGEDTLFSWECTLTG